MTNPTAKTKFRAVLKAAIWGGLIFAALTTFGMVGCVIFRGYFFGGLYFWAVVPETQLEILLTGKMSLNPFNGSLFLLIVCCTAINGLLGAVFAVFCRFVLFIIKDFLSDVKRNHEK